MCAPQTRLRYDFVIRVLAIVAIACAILGVGLVVAIGKSTASVAAYVVTVVGIPLGYLLAFLFKKPIYIPSSCVALIRHPLGHTICEGPAYFHPLPLVQKGIAIVPLGICNYVSSKQKIALKDNKSVEVSLAVRYRVSARRQNGVLQREDIVRAVDAALESSASLMIDRNKLWRTSDLRGAWQHKLVEDIRMTLYESRRLLADLDEKNQIEIGDRLQSKLQSKTKEWGIEIEAVWVAESKAIKQ